MITNYEGHRHKHFTVIQKKNNKQTGKDLITRYIYIYIYNDHFCMKMSDGRYILFTKRKMVTNYEQKVSLILNAT